MHVAQRKAHDRFFSPRVHRTLKCASQSKSIGSRVERKENVTYRLEDLFDDHVLNSPNYVRDFVLELLGEISR